MAFQSPAILQGAGKIFFLGNCQVNKLSLMTKLDRPNSTVGFRTITEFWGTFEPELCEQDIAEADLVVCQLVLSPGYRFFHERVREMAKGEVIFTPYFYLDGFGALEIISSKGVNRIQGMDLLAPAFAERPKGQVTQRFLRDEYDMKVEDRFARSLAEIRLREGQGADFGIADHIEQIYREQPVCFAINHPTPVMLDYMYSQLAGLIGFAPAALHDRPHFDQGRLNLPRANRVFSPYVCEALGLSYPGEEHWYSAAVKLIETMYQRLRREGAQVVT